MGDDHRFPNLGFDPAPGDVHGTRQLSRDIGKVAGELGTTATQLERIDSGYWKGKAATAFCDHVAEDVTPDMQRAHLSFDRAARALRRWANQLDGFQDEARALEREAARKQQALGEAERLRDAGKPSPHPGASDDGEAGEEAKKRQEKREEGVEDAGDALDDVRRRAEELAGRYYDAAAAICRDLEFAGDIAPDEPGLFDSIADGISDVLDGAVEFVQDHADLIKAIGDVLSYVTAALTVLAIATAPFPPIGGAFASAALMYAGLTMLTHGIAKAAGADVSWATLGLDALGLLPGMGAFGKGIKIAERGAAAARVGQLGGRFAMKPVEGMRNIVSVGDLAGTVQGGVKLVFNGKGVALWGKHDEIFLVADEASKLGTKIAAIAEPTRSGQIVGSLGLGMITGGKVAIDPLSAGGRMLDMSAKMAPKLVSIPQHIGESVDLGDRFAAAFGH